MPVTKQTAMDIALAYREIETADELLTEITAARRRHENPDIRDAFGRPTAGLQLGVPNGSANSRTLFNVPWPIAKAAIETHIANQRAVLITLNEKARIELDQEEN